MNIPEHINGDDLLTGAPEPFQALACFYAAFNRRDYQQAADNWHRDHALMSNPIGGMRRSWCEVHDGYQRIMTGPAVVYVEFYDYTWHLSDDMFYIAGRERGSMQIDGEKLPLHIRTSRIYRRIDGHWWQVHHHGSIDDAALLARYQHAIMASTTDHAALKTKTTRL